MNTETMLGFLRRQPFQPFEVQMSNGDAFQIRHSNAVLLLKSSLIIGSIQSDDFTFCELSNVNEIQPLEVV
jgi:hypothetical protein